MKKGFSLTEVLISLAIMGILAAILLPTVQKTTPDKNKIVFRKAYNTIAQGVSNLIYDEVNYPSSQVDTTTGLMKGLNYTVATSNIVSSVTYNKFCYFLLDTLNTIGATSPTTACPQAGDTSGANGFFTTSDGVVWTITYASGANDTTTGTPSGTDKQFPLTQTLTSYPTKIIVDVDGPAKGPNCSTDSAATSYKFGSGTGTALVRCTWYNTCTDGTANPANSTPDRYIVGVRFDGKLQVGSGDDTDKCANNILLFSTSNTTN